MIVKIYPTRDNKATHTQISLKRLILHPAFLNAASKRSFSRSARARSSLTRCKPATTSSLAGAFPPTDAFRPRPEVPGGSVDARGTESLFRGIVATGGGVGGEAEGRLGGGVGGGGSGVCSTTVPFPISLTSGVAIGVSNSDVRSETDVFPTEAVGISVISMDSPSSVNETLSN